MASIGNHTVDDSFQISFQTVPCTQIRNSYTRVSKINLTFGIPRSSKLLSSISTVALPDPFATLNVVKVELIRRDDLITSSFSDTTTPSFRNSLLASVSLERIKVILVVSLIDHLFVLDDDADGSIDVVERVTRFEGIESKSFDRVERSISVRRAGVD